MNHSISRFLTLIVASAVLSCSASAKDANTAKPVKKTTVALKDAKGNSVGSATIKTSGKGVEVKLDVKDLPPGVHALHFHQNAKCDPPGLQIGRAAFQS